MHIIVGLLVWEFDGWIVKYHYGHECYKKMVTQYTLFSDVATISISDSQSATGEPFSNAMINYPPPPLFLPPKHRCHH